MAYVAHAWYDNGMKLVLSGLHMQVFQTFVMRAGLPLPVCVVEQSQYALTGTGLKAGIYTVDITVEQYNACRSIIEAELTLDERSWARTVTGVTQRELLTILNNVALTLFVEDAMS